MPLHSPLPTARRNRLLTWTLPLALTLASSLDAANVAPVSEPAHRALCRYQQSTDWTSTLTWVDCDARQKASFDDHGWTLTERLGFVLDPAESASGTKPLCVFFHDCDPSDTEGRDFLTSDRCTVSEVAARYGRQCWHRTNGPANPIGRVFDQPAAGRIPICEYKHAYTEQMFVTTACSNSAVDELAGYDLYPIDPGGSASILGYVRSPGSPPYMASQIVRNGDLELEVFQSDVRDRRLYAQRFLGYPSELPPLVLPDLGADGADLVLLSTGWTWQCSSTANFLEDPLVGEGASGGLDACELATEPDVLDRIDTAGIYYRQPEPDGPVWRRTYNGILGMHSMRLDRGQHKLIGFTHGENQNLNVSGQPWIMNNIKTIQDPLTRDGCHGDLPVCSGPTSPKGCCDPETENCYANCGGNFIPGEPWINGWSQFGSFVSLVEGSKHRHDPAMPALEDERGPVLWSRGAGSGLPEYLYEDMGAAGPYHPSSALDEHPAGSGGMSKVYLYFHNSEPCLQMASADVDPQSGSVGDFNLWTGTDFIGIAMPDGYSQSAPEASLGTAGGHSTCVFGDEGWGKRWKHHFFSVARLRENGSETNCWISVEERIGTPPDQAPQSGVEIVLRISDNPYDWKHSDALRLDWQPGLFGASPLTYARFVDHNGLTTGAVDKEGFFIVGNQPSSGFQIHARALKIGNIQGCEP